MKMIMKTLMMFALFTGLTASAAEGWETDFEAASAQAKEEGKYLLLDFTGSDWCGWCIKLDKEVFSQDEFKAYASDSLVTVMLDFPRRKEIDADTKAQNMALKEKYGIRGYPTILILSPEGELIKKTGYRPGGAATYVEHLKEIVDGHKGSDKPMAEAVPATQEG